MSNNCFNYLVLRHADKSKLEEVWTACMRGYNFYPNDASDLLNWFCPQPNYDHLSGDELNELFKQLRIPKDETERLSYYWRLGNWGTKKIDWTSRCKLAERAVWVSFVTADAPPVAAYQAAIDDHGFELEAGYDEENFRYSGAFGADFHVHFDYNYEGLPENFRKILDQFAVELNEKDGKVLENWNHY